MIILGILGERDGVDVALLEFRDEDRVLSHPDRRLARTDVRSSETAAVHTREKERNATNSDRRSSLLAFSSFCHSGESLLGVPTTAAAGKQAR